jgi:hypothetical protein
VKNKNDTEGGRVMSKPCKYCGYITNYANGLCYSCDELSGRIERKPDIAIAMVFKFLDGFTHKQETPADTEAMNRKQ